MTSPADAALHLVRRTTYGPTPELVDEVQRKGPAAWLESQLSPLAIPDPGMAALLPRWPELQWSALLVKRRYDFGWEAMYALRDAHTARAVWSERQLLEVMVDLWSNALNVPCPSSDVSRHRHLYDRDVIRRHAFGRFEDMLVAAVKHPAMLRYLDASSSTGDNPNENLGRELLEVHTVGRGSRYTERDVKHSALILTGFTVDDRTQFAEFRPRDHYVGAVRVLGFRHPNRTAAGGKAVATAYLRYLARHPLTAQRIARRLAVRFVSDSPSKALVNSLAKTYVRKGTAIKPVLRQLFRSPEFLGSAGAKTRTPYEDLIATARVLGVRPPAAGDKLGVLVWAPDWVGQPPMAWPRPDGYPDQAAAFVGTGSTLGRWNAHVALACKWDKQLTYADPATWLPSPVPATYGELVKALSKRMFVDLTDRQVEAVCGFLDQSPSAIVKPKAEILGWRLPFVAALILCAPQAALR